MVKSYPKKRGSSESTCGFLKHLFLVFVSFIAGYVFATCYDYTKVMQWVSDCILKPRQLSHVEKPLQAAQLPKPKFEFYTLLTKETNRATSSPAAVVERNQSQLPIEDHLPIDEALDEHGLQKAEPIPQVVSSTIVSKDSYLVQLASFRRPQDADKMKASLAMKGYHVSVVAVSQKNIYWYRVVLGPFVNKSEAQRTQQTIARSERIKGMVRKLDA